VVSRDAFVAERQPDWNALDQLLGKGSLQRLSAPEIGRLAALYRAASADLMRARALSLGTDVTAYLDALVSRGHSRIYGPRPYSPAAAIDLLFVAFPRTLRRHARLFAVACALFFVPLLVGLALSLRSEEFAFGVMPREELQQAAWSYTKGYGGRTTGTNAFMAGFYVQNNVGIAFRCFATGVLFGLGSVFFLFYNGLLIGTTIGFVARAGGGENIFNFICGHAPFELTAIVIAGTAGLRLGHALIATRGRTRWGSVRQVSGELGNLILGAAAMLLVAAAIEGFWSPSALPPIVKWIFAVLGATVIPLFLLLAGRRRAA
jgi:uncharacterized membrane protein SpoIIM required for sporulation